MSSKTQIAQALAGGSPAVYDSQGLQQPPEVTAAIMSLLMPGLGSAAEDVLASAPQKLGSEAGAIFPEAAPIETLSEGGMKELGNVLTPAQKAYRLNEATANWHAGNYDWPGVLADKWRLLMHHGGS